MGKHKREGKSKDPNNVAWSRDTERYGYRMLETMGWQAGGGLGRDGEGRTDPLTVTRKLDVNGVGQSGDDGRWLGTHLDFTSLLASLNQSFRAAVPESAECHVQLQHARTPDGGEAVTLDVDLVANPQHRPVFAKRFRAKDASTYSSADMNQIMGRPAHSTAGEEEPAAEEAAEAMPDVEVRTSAVDVHSYFQQKKEAARERALRVLHGFEAPTEVDRAVAAAAALEARAFDARSFDFGDASFKGSRTILHDEEEPSPEWSALAADHTVRSSKRSRTEVSSSSSVMKSSDHKEKKKTKHKEKKRDRRDEEAQKKKKEKKKDKKKEKNK